MQIFIMFFVFCSNAIPYACTYSVLTYHTLPLTPSSLVQSATVQLIAAIYHAVIVDHMYKREYLVCIRFGRTRNHDGEVYCNRN